ncbi:hypothetical protein [Roseivivax sp. CAU 1753]
MTEKEVYGVVLWANAQNGTAVIWCEDQGELAYVTADSDSTHLGADIDAGDMILCCVDDDAAAYRRARNLRRIEVGSHKALPRVLVRRETSERSSNVVPIQTARRDAPQREESCVA